MCFIRGLNQQFFKPSDTKDNLRQRPPEILTVTVLHYA